MHSAGPRAKGLVAVTPVFPISENWEDSGQPLSTVQLSLYIRTYSAHVLGIMSIVRMNK